MTMSHTSYFPEDVTTSEATNDIPRDAIATFHRSLPRYRVTALYSCPTIAQRLGVKSVLVKDESVRLGLPSFKMLGASWATATAIGREWIGSKEPPVSLRWIDREMRRRFGPKWRIDRRLVAATDGNHGRGVARMARVLRLPALIFVPAGTAESRIRGIENEGARVEVVEGTYDDAIARSAREASSTTLVISDTSWEGYTETPTNVINGYSTMFSEMDQQLSGKTLDIVTLQAGVGAFAAAGMSHWSARDANVRPRFVVVEPTAANCLMLSARSREITLAPGPHDSTMAGLNCGLPSLIAWPVISQFADAFVAIDDDIAFDTMRLLADCGIVAGESGAAGLAGLLAITDESERSLMGLHSDATVLVINTEGATDPDNYKRVVGSTNQEVIRTRRRRQHVTQTVRLPDR
ncbi:MAG: diaminopropionate ammonia-lyase [Actinobacteria bacterium]|nr:diaminopropionate ammonia-lyase [Actinomycetota bacterium]